VSAEPRFRCAFCPESFARFSAYSEHVRAAHPERGAYFCCLCRTAFPALAGFEAHEEAEHVQKTPAAEQPQPVELPWPEAEPASVSKTHDS
jgi:hypothetical protein